MCFIANVISLRISIGVAYLDTCLFTEITLPYIQTYSLTAVWHVAAETLNIYVYIINIHIDYSN